MKKYIFILCASFILAGCASTIMVDMNGFQVRENIYPAPVPDTALVYFYSDMAFTDPWYIYDGDKQIGGVWAGYYFFTYANPGEHWFKAADRFIMIKTEPAKTYYVCVSTIYEFFGSFPILMLVPPDFGANTVRNLKYATLKE
jgi:hypothetical protein